MEDTQVSENEDDPLDDDELTQSGNPFKIPESKKVEQEHCAKH